MKVKTKGKMKVNLLKRLLAGDQHGWASFLDVLSGKVPIRVYPFFHTHLSKTQRSNISIKRTGKGKPV